MKKKPIDTQVVSDCFKFLVSARTVVYIYIQGIRGRGLWHFMDFENCFVTAYLVTLLRGCEFSDLQILALGN